MQAANKDAAAMACGVGAGGRAGARGRQPRQARSGRGGLPAGVLDAATMVLALLVLLPPSAHGFELSCASSRVPAPAALDFCGPVVAWRAAAVYSHINYTDFQAGARFADADQDRIAKRQYEDLVFGRGQVSAPCAQALQRLVCASVFPECPHDGFGVPFKPVCRPTCREAEAACGVPLSCDFLQSSDCTATPTAAADGMGGLEEGFFLLKDDQGPYEPLPYLYGALLAVWTALSLVWLFNICRPHATSSGQRRRPASRLCTILTCVPLAKVAMMLLSLSFWSTCVTWGVCSFWMGVSLINCQLLYETFSLVGFVLIAKGWCITRPGFHPHEWRTVIVLMCAFYLASSSLLLVRRVVLSSAVFWLCTGLLYGSAYGYVLFNVREQVQRIQRHMRRARRAGSTGREARFRHDLMRLKHWMYQTLSVLLTLFCATELVFCLLPLAHHVDLTFLPQGVRAFLDALAELDARLWLTLIVHEVVEIAVLFMVGFLFRPRLLTTFYYGGLWEEEGAGGDSRGKRGGLRAPPLYLIPVPGGQYHHRPAGMEAGADAGGATTDPDSAAVPRGSGGLIIPRKELSPSDLQFTLSSSNRGRRAVIRRRRREQQQEERPARSASAAGVLEEDEAAAAATAAAVQRQQPQEPRGEEADRLLDDELLSSLSSSSSSSEMEGEESGAEQEQEQEEEEHLLVKPVLQYHASRFLVVQLPNGMYAVAVAEEEQQEGGQGAGEGDRANG